MSFSEMSRLLAEAARDVLSGCNLLQKQGVELGKSLIQKRNERS